MFEKGRLSRRWGWMAPLGFFKLMKRILSGHLANSVPVCLSLRHIYYISGVNRPIDIGDIKWQVRYGLRADMKIRGARVAQWWERSPPSNVSRVRILASTSYVGWVYCWFSPLLREVFLRVLRFSPLLKNQHFQIPIRSGTHGHVSTSSYELLSASWVNKLQFTIYNGSS